MRRCTVPLMIALFGLLLAPVSVAEDVVEFVDGRFLEISSYRVQDGWIRMYLSADDYFVFPASRVSTIKRNGRLVYAASNGPISGPRHADKGKTGTDEPLLAALRSRTRTPVRR